ncbi:hypothetical protein [Albibacillus kandeliae]|uniref:hypothetical protein n=1 Tax=Albibacillus kandeliae TaxID=2174228 RepID=UPI000D698127|nr:hypothetical protein [Albibacillus kandeliae]
MPLSFPLDRDTFLGAARITEQTFYLSENVEISGLGDGSIIRDDLGPRLWRGSCMVEHASLAEGRRLSSQIALLQATGASFLAWDISCTAPAADPDGSNLSGSSPVIYQLESNNREMRISGLPVGYELTPGDMLSFTYGSSPIRYALHSVVTGAVASGDGITPLFEVVPPLRPGAAVSAPVELLRPFCKAVIVPSSAQPFTARNVKKRGLSFEFVQTLR